jgi:hypothetical protein
LKKSNLFGCNAEKNRLEKNQKGIGFAILEKQKQKKEKKKNTPRGARRAIFNAF